MTISLRYILDELKRQNIDFRIIDEDTSLIEVYFKDLSVPIMFRITNSEFSGSLGRYLSDRKDLSYLLVAETVVGLPETIEYSDEKQLEDFFTKHGVVVSKPHNGAHGDFVATNIKTFEDLLKIVKSTLEEYDSVIIQEQVSGQDVRVLFIGDKFEGAVIRHPASVVGDGESTILSLIEKENSRSERGLNYSTDLNEINVKSARQYLGDKINSTPDANSQIKVIGSANVGLGGLSEDITSTIHPEIVRLAKIVKDKLRITHAGIDFMINDPTSAPNDTDNKIYFIEANSGPMLAFHEKPNIGEGRPISRIYIQWIKDQALEKYN